ncbi:MAG: glycosyltransferase family 117 protein, partial [Bacteroidota bacterium]
MTTRLNPSHVIKNRIIGGFSFLIALIVYTITVSPTASFWDPGEYIAIAHTLQIAHPPGSPFFALWGRLFSMFSPPEWVALSVNMISVLTSSFTILLLYLITVRLLSEWQGDPDNWNPSQQISGYGGALVGSLTFVFTHTHWFNAVEAEMYAPSMFFTALVVWIALIWAKDHEKPAADRWLILIAYIFGLGIGVHLLNLLALFFVALIIYFKRWTFSIRSFLLMGVITVLLFLSIYPVTIIWIPSLADNMQQWTYGMLGAGGYFAIIGGLLVLAIRHTHKRKMRLANLIMIGYAVILIGYSSYALILIRSIADPPIDENDPSTIEAFVSYLNRDQYGQSPLLVGATYDNETGQINREEESFLPRRHSAHPRHLEYYSQFDSDWDYFWHYQVNHMYLRYFAWNFIGRESDIQDAGWYSGFRESPHRENPANSAYYFLPFLVGLIGLYWHMRNDPHRAFAVSTLFLMTGLAIIFYLNQTPFEPRERDYAYVGSFFAFSIWIGIGATALLSRIPSHLPSSEWIQRGVLGGLLLALPVWMAMENWPSHDRSHNYVARDYAWNLLQSVDENAILFTNGDNDTFPLWYLQEVENVRTDVRVVNLSLLNTAWYIKQLRDRTTHESLPLPIRLTDAEIDEMTSALSLHEPDTLSIPVDYDWLSNVFSGEITPEQVDDPVLSNQVAMATPYSIPVDSLDSSVDFYLEGRYAGQGADGNDRYYLQVQDLMILEILENNQWARPVYFANT